MVVLTLYSEYSLNMPGISIRTWLFRLTKSSCKKSKLNRIQNCILTKLVQLIKEKERETTGLINVSRVSVQEMLSRTH